MDMGLRAPQEPRADLNRAGAERQGCGCTAAVGDAAGGHDRHTDRIHYCWQQREQAHLASLRRGRIKTPAMPPSLRALDDDDIRAGCSGHPRFCDRRSVGKPPDAGGLEPRDESVGVQPHD